MKIVFFTDHIFKHGGIERVLIEKANYFAEILSYQVAIVTSQQADKAPCYKLSEKVDLVDLKINYNRTKSYLNIGNLLKAPSHFRKRCRYLKKHNPDVVIVVNYDLDFFWTPFIHSHSKKVKEYHSSQYMRGKENNGVMKRLRDRIIKKIEKKYHALVVLNNEERQFFESKNTIVIPNPISIPDKQANLENEKVVVAGRIAPVKGFDRLLEIWALVVKRFPDWELHFYGEDYLATQSKLETQVEEYGLQQNVSFKGVTSNMIDTMLDYSLYLMTSYNESFSMVILEAMSVGLPTVGFDVPTGPRSLITSNVDGVLIKDNDLNAFADAVCILIQDNTQRKEMGINARRRSLDFSNENIMMLWKQFFNEIV